MDTIKVFHVFGPVDYTDYYAYKAFDFHGRSVQQAPTKHTLKTLWTGLQFKRLWWASRTGNLHKQLRSVPIVIPNIALHDEWLKFLKTTGGVMVEVKDTPAEQVSWQT